MLIVFMRGLSRHTYWRWDTLLSAHFIITILLYILYFLCFIIFTWEAAYFMLSYYYYYILFHFELYYLLLNAIYHLYHHFSIFHIFIYIIIYFIVIYISFICFFFSIFASIMTREWCPPSLSLFRRLHLAFPFLSHIMLFEREPPDITTYLSYPRELLSTDTQHSLPLSFHAIIFDIIFYIYLLYATLLFPSLISWLFLPFSFSIYLFTFV